MVLLAGMLSPNSFPRGQFEFPGDVLPPDEDEPTPFHRAATQPQFQSNRPGVAPRALSLRDEVDPPPDYSEAVRRTDRLVMASERTTRPAAPAQRKSSFGGFRGSRLFNKNQSQPQAPPPVQSDDDIILVTVKLANRFRKNSADGADDLPGRPPARSFLRRLSTHLHLDHSAEREERYRAVRMPRREYRRFFARDPATGAYAGSEPEREWSDEDVDREFGQYGAIPLTASSAVTGTNLSIGGTSTWGWA